MNIRDKKRALEDTVSGLLYKAERYYGVDLENRVLLQFDLSGKVSARVMEDGGNYILRVNLEALEKYFDRMLGNTMPHEVAHLVCFELDTDYGHGKEWRKVCIKLGGDGECYHTYALTPARKTKKFRYIASCGTRVEVGLAVHNKIQSGQNRRILKTGGTVTAIDFRPDKPNLRTVV